MWCHSSYYPQIYLTVKEFLKLRFDYLRIYINLCHPYLHSGIICNSCSVSFIYQYLLGWISSPHIYRQFIYHGMFPGITILNIYHGVCFIQTFLSKSKSLPACKLTFLYQFFLTPLFLGMDSIMNIIQLHPNLLCLSYSLTFPFLIILTGSRTQSYGRLTGPIA